MKYFQSDDIPNSENLKDCIHKHYKIVVDGNVIKQGRYALKQTKNVINRCVFVRSWNESKKVYITDWMPLPVSPETKNNNLNLKNIIWNKQKREQLKNK